MDHAAFNGLPILERGYIPETEKLIATADFVPALPYQDEDLLKTFCILTSTLPRPLLARIFKANGELAIAAVQSMSTGIVVKLNLVVETSGQATDQDDGEGACTE